MLARVRNLADKGIIRSFHAFVAHPPTSSGKSTLVALNVPEHEISRTVAIINEYISVTHNYRRDFQYNIWFTLNERNEIALDQTLDEIKGRTGISNSAILDLRTLRVFKVDVRFPLIKGRVWNTRGLISVHEPRQLDETDQTLLRITQEGISYEREPFQEVALTMGISQDEVIQRLNRLHRTGIVKRIGISVNQRKLGLVANALVAWKVPQDSTELTGSRLASFPGVTHCYERSTVPGRWEYNIFTVHHGYDRQSVNNEVSSLAEAMRIPNYLILYSTEQFKRTSMIHRLPVTSSTSAQRSTLPVEIIGES